MRKVLQRIPFMATLSQAFGDDNLTNTSPFQGEYSHVNIIEGENRTTHRAIPVQHPNKYATLISQIDSDQDGGSRSSFTETLYEGVFGASEESRRLSEAV